MLVFSGKALPQILIVCADNSHRSRNRFARLPQTRVANRAGQRDTKTFCCFMVKSQKEFSLHTVSCQRCHLQLFRRICKWVGGWWRESKRDGAEMGEGDVGVEKLRGSGTLKHVCIPISVEIPPLATVSTPLFLFRPDLYSGCASTWPRIAYLVSKSAVSDVPAIHYARRMQATN
jgi:hypothetical protein